MPFVRRMDILAQSQGAVLLCKPTDVQLNCNKKHLGLFSKSSENSCLTKKQIKSLFLKKEKSSPSPSPYFTS